MALSSSHTCLHTRSAQLTFSPVAPKARRCMRVQAANQQEKNRSGLDFTPNLSKNTGYMKEDSAGQENIFAVESKSFVQGGPKDINSGSPANAIFAGLAASVAVLLIAGGIFVTKDKAEVPVTAVLKDVPTESLSSISKRLSATKKAVSAAVSEAPALSE